jgi:hypothetical protein
MSLAAAIEPDSFMMQVTGPRRWDYLFRFGPPPGQAAAPAPSQPAWKVANQRIAQERARAMLERLVSGLNEEFRRGARFPRDGSSEGVSTPSRDDAAVQGAHPHAEAAAAARARPERAAAVAADAGLEAGLERDSSLRPAEGDPWRGWDRSAEQPATSPPAAVVAAAVAPPAVRPRAAAGTEAGAEAAPSPRGTFTLGIESVRGDSFEYRDGAFHFPRITTVEGIRVEAGTVIDTDLTDTAGFLDPFDNGVANGVDNGVDVVDPAAS